ncbi:hypothetical protein Q0590_35805 [Rhodocytophaga aerolata]|uniref:Uncharacterized protein n=1 Tax=Rhodocytophaga aerolata TaxID=455078 RepID=A0ABT8RHX4_9BACT|nr:hypothetical protein [Rhodocytophaga aerolata]MDO1451694.1 hypothetical protein [Rhodocytophaga aerolata]
MLEYPKSSGRRPLYACEPIDESILKKENITIACTAYLKERFYQLGIDEGLVISQLGERILWLVFAIQENLDGQSLIAFLEGVQQELEQLQRELQAEKKANSLLRAKLLAIENQIKGLSEEAAEQKAAIAYHQTKYRKYQHNIDRAISSEQILEKLYAIYGQAEISREMLAKEGFDFQLCFTIVEVENRAVTKLFEYGYEQLSETRYKIYQLEA